MDLGAGTAKHKTIWKEKRMSENTQKRIVKVGRIVTQFDKDGKRFRIVPPWFR